MPSPTDLTYLVKPSAGNHLEQKKKVSSPTLLDRQDMAKIVLDDVLGVPSRSQATCHHAALSEVHCRICKQGRHLLSNLRIPVSSASLESDIDSPIVTMIVIIQHTAIA